MKKNQILLCCAFVLAFFIRVSSQNKIDSLNTLLKKDREDTVKLRHLNLISKTYTTFGKTDSAIYFSKLALKLSEELLKKQAFGNNDIKKGRAEAFNNLGVIYDGIGNYKEALEQHAAAQNLRKEANDVRGMAGSYNNIGMVYWHSGKYALALENYSSAVKLNEKTGNKNWLANNYGNIGLIYLDLGNFPLALKNQFLALRLRDETGNKEGLATSWNIIGSIYREQGNYKEALATYFKALKLSEESGAMGKIASSNLNIGNVYYYQKNYPEALKYYLIALEIREEIGDKNGMAAAYSNLGSVYAEQGNFTAALKSHIASVKLKEQIGDENGVAIATTNLGLTYLLYKKYIDANIYLSKGQSLAKKLGLKSSLRDNYKGLADLETARGNFKAALENYKFFVAYRDSLSNEENTQKTVQSQMQYEFDKKSTADSIKNAEVRKLEDLQHQEEISRQQTYTYGGIAGFLVMIVVAGISFNAFRTKKKANIEIAKQKTLVEEKQKEILDSIYYARRIQNALITSEKYITRKLHSLTKK